MRQGQALLAHQEVARILRELQRAAAHEEESSQIYEGFVNAGPAVGGDAFLSRFEQGERLAASMLDAGHLRSERQDQLAEGRDAAMRAQREVALLDKLDQRRRREWVLRAQREDTAILDEFATTRAAATARKHQ
jgi:hypothetical protein